MPRNPTIRRAIPRAFASVTLALTLLGLPVVSPDPQAPRVRHDRVSLDLTGATVAPSALRTIERRDPFRLVGLTWADDAPGHALARTSPDGAAWGEWTELEPYDAGPDPGSGEGDGRTATEPLWIDEARFVQVRWEGRRGPSDATLHLIHPGRDPAPPLPLAAAQPGRPNFITRAQWGADESIRKCCPRVASELKAGIVHHTATSNGYAPGDSAGIVRSIYAYHVQGNGWDDIGYNVVIDRYGQVFEGRAGGVEKPVIGAHSQGFNTNSTGIAVIGTFGSAPPQVAVDRIVDVLAWKFDLHYVDPLGTTQMTSGGSNKHPAGTVVTLPRILGHSDVQTTACPGQGLYDLLGSIRTATRDRGAPKLFHPALSRSSFSPNGDGRDETVRITGGTTPGASWTVRAIERGVGERRRWTGTGSIDITWDGSATGGPAPHGHYDIRWDAQSGGAGARHATFGLSLYRSTWEPWTGTGNPADLPADPQIASGPDGRTHVVYRAVDGGLFHSVRTGGSWSLPSRLGGAGDRAHPNSPIAVLSDRASILHVVVRGVNDAIYHASVFPDGRSGGWRRVGSGPEAGTDPVLAMDHVGTLHLLIAGTDQRLYVNSWPGRWTGWRRAGRSIDKGSAPAIASTPDGTVTAVIIGTDQGIYANARAPGGGWRSRWSRIGRSVDQGYEPAITGLGDGRFLVAVRGTDTRIYRVAGRTGAWSGWSRVGRGADAGFEPALSSGEGNAALMIIRGTDDAVYGNARRPDGSWVGWGLVGGTKVLGRVPAGAGAWDGTAVFVVESDGVPQATTARAPFWP